MLELKALAINTKAIRIKKKETQLTFGLNCGLSEDEICNIENQNTDLKLRYNSKYCNLYRLNSLRLIKSLRRRREK